MVLEPRPPETTLAPAREFIVVVVLGSSSSSYDNATTTTNNNYNISKQCRDNIGQPLPATAYGISCFSLWAQDMLADVLPH